MSQAIPEGPGPSLPLADSKCQVSRELYYHERTDSQKIEKLTEAVVYLTNELKGALEAIDVLMIHSHMDGKMVTPLRDPQNPPYPQRGHSYFFRNPLGFDLDRRATRLGL